MNERPNTPRVPAFSYSNLTFTPKEECPWCKHVPPPFTQDRAHYIDGELVTEFDWYREGARYGVPLVAPLRNGSPT